MGAVFVFSGPLGESATLTDVTELTSSLLLSMAGSGLDPEFGWAVGTTMSQEHGAKLEEEEKHSQTTGNLRLRVSTTRPASPCSTTSTRTARCGTTLRAITRSGSSARTLTHSCPSLSSPVRSMRRGYSDQGGYYLF